jgi:AcrR family transcriptional regulator
MGLREQKKQQTHAALVDAAARLFAERGYDRTTVADIAAAANVSTRTFFSYFRAKEDVLFAGTDQRLRALAEAFAADGPISDGTLSDRPLETVHRILEHVLSGSDDLPGPDRLAIMLTHPELQAQALQRLVAAQRLIADWLRRAYPDRLDGPLSQATSGAMVGALVGTVLSGASPQSLRTHLHRALTLLGDGLRTLGP